MTEESKKESLQDPQKKGQLWTEEDDSLLLELVKDKDLIEISAKLERTERGVRNRLILMAIREIKKNETPEDKYNDVAGNFKLEARDIEQYFTVLKNKREKKRAKKPVQQESKVSEAKSDNNLVAIHNMLKDILNRLDQIDKKLEK